MKNIDIEIMECDFSNTDCLNAIGNLMNTYIQDSMGGGNPLSGMEKLRLVDSLNEHPTSIVLLARVDNVFCGLLIAFENFSTFTVKPMINIHDLIVLPELRNSGIGHKLLDSIIEIAEKRGCSRITLEVRNDNINAQYLYKKMGFGEAEPPMHYWRKNF